jgi:hypothetical protein
LVQLLIKKFIASVASLFRDTVYDMESGTACHLRRYSDRCWGGVRGVAVSYMQAILVFWLMQWRFQK